MNGIRSIACCCCLITASCGALDAPEKYKGSVQGVHFAVPRRYVIMPVLYEGESDWTPPTQLKSLRTFDDPITTIEFFIDVDRPNTLISESEGRRKQLLSENSPRPDRVVFGHMLMVTAQAVPTGTPAQRIARNRNEIMSGSTLRSAKPAGEIFDIPARAADRKSPEFLKGLELGEKADLELYDLAQGIRITCDYRFTVPDVKPRRNVSTCHMWAFEPNLPFVFHIAFDRVDLASWRLIRSSAIKVVTSFISTDAGARAAARDLEHHQRNALI